VSFTILGVNVGRLQKKKNSAKKKKKRMERDGSSLQPQTSLPEKKSSVFTSSTPEANRGNVFSQRQPSSAPISPKAGRGTIGKALQFLREVRVELKKVTWPSRKQTIGSTVVVLILVIIISFFLGAVDLGLDQLVRMILQ